MNFEEIEAKIFPYLKKCLKKHQKTPLPKIIQYCFDSINTENSTDNLQSNELTPSIEDVKFVIQDLIKNKKIVISSTLTHQDIIENDTRLKILKFIRVNPGCYNRLIRRSLNIEANEFGWHVDLLIKFGYVKKIKFSSRSFGYFEDRDYMGHEYDLFLLQNEKIEQILKHLKKKKGRVSEIYKEIGLHYSTVRKYLEILLERDIVKIDDTESSQVYELNSEMIIKLRKIINGQVFLDFAEDFSF